MLVLCPAICSTLLRATAISHSFMISFRNSHFPIPAFHSLPILIVFSFHKEKNSLVFSLASFASAASITSSCFRSTPYSFKTTAWSSSLSFLLAFTFCTQMQQLLKSLAFAVIQTSGTGLIFHSSWHANSFSWLGVFTSEVLVSLTQSYPDLSNCCSGCHSKEQLHAFFYALWRIIWSSFLLKLYSGTISSINIVSTTISSLDATPLLQDYHTLQIGISANTDTVNSDKNFWYCKFRHQLKLNIAKLGLLLPAPTNSSCQILPESLCTVAPSSPPFKTPVWMLSPTQIILRSSNPDQVMQNLSAQYCSYTIF